MPDWSYHTFFKPLLFRMNSESSRDFTLHTMNTLAKLPFGDKIIQFFGHMQPSKELERKVAGVTFPSPVGISGALDPQLNGTQAFTNLGFGFIEVGPISVSPRKSEKPIIRDTGKETLVYDHLQENLGLEATLIKLQSMKRVKIPLGILIKGETLHDYEKLVQKLDEHAAFFVINVEGISYLELIRGLTSKPLMLELTHQKIKYFSEDIAVDGYIIREGIESAEGVELGQLEMHQLKESIQQLLPFNKPIIASGGVHEPRDAMELLEVGASLIQLHSGFVYSGPGLPKRINERILYDQQPISKPAEQTGWISFFLMGLGVFIAGIIALIIGLTEVLLAYDEQYLGIKKEEIQTFSHHLFHFMSHDRICLAGVMISAGFMFMQLSYNGIRKGEHWAKKAYMIAAALGFLNIFYFMGFGYFDMLHFVYYLIILPFFLYGLYQSRNFTSGSKGQNLHNTISWKRSQIGQSLFVISGICLLSAGIVISIIGMNGVFVKEDLMFFALTPEQISAFNQNLIPLIAHDRAGFGGALISEGFLLLTIALWGYREGEKWVWWTLLLGGLPGFLTGVGTHFMIGYDNHFHLSPAYLLFVFYFVGLVYSYGYLHRSGEAQLRNVSVWKEEKV
ncbi:dihydroorotate dehydrogenase [Fictibacillus phosphorivorans]|uniref:dihydroorotate dehydrogenase n=1 Tax=Fictibacillus phosphorivorans TaxID=1221500 RepID=UPI001293884A|nr:dihydroorotate dehydrogenase [Fictibacillus phosphorivorans]MQR94862.1 dihydroorotate dehydrogenase [Fictibacillus phosphorivorans]